MTRSDGVRAWEAPRLILASSSPRRRELLDLIGIDHVVAPSNVDEAVEEKQAAELVRNLSRAKALAVSGRYRGDLVLAADTIVALDDLVIGKPTNSDEALFILRQLRGRTHRVLTGISLVNPFGNVTTALEETMVTVRQVSDDKLRAYIQTGEPLDKAGAYGIQGRGAALVESIEGCYSNVVGLPLCLCCQLLARSGIHPRRVVWGHCQKDDRCCPLDPPSQYLGLPKAGAPLQE